MPEEELDLLQFAAGGAAQSGTASAQVVRRELAAPCLFRDLLNDVPGKFLGHPVSPSFAGAAHTTEHLSSLESCSFDPRAEFAIDPVWDRHRPDMAALAAEVYDRPMSFPLLKVINRQLGDFVSPQPARKQKGQECPVALAFETACVRSLPERDPLFGRQPVAQPHAKFLYALGAPDASRKVGAEESAVYGLAGQPTNGPQPEVDRPRGEMPRLQLHPIANDDRLTEGQPRLGEALAVRLKKLAIDGEKTLQGVAELAYQQSFQV
jgi:hypothetical protein